MASLNPFYIESFVARLAQSPYANDEGGVPKDEWTILDRVRRKSGNVHRQHKRYSLDRK